MEFSGIVAGGSARAQSLGYPTANILFNDTSIAGIYAAQVTLEGRQYAAVAFADPERGVLEAHLFDFSGDLYGKEIRVSLVEKIRDSKAFENDLLLKEAMVQDAAEARRLLS